MGSFDFEVIEEADDVAGHFWAVFARVVGFSTLAVTTQVEGDDAIAWSGAELGIAGG